MAGDRNRYPIADSLFFAIILYFLLLYKINEVAYFSKPTIDDLNIKYVFYGKNESISFAFCSSNAFTSGF